MMNVESTSRPMTDREMLALAYGAICVDAAQNANMERVRDMIADHLWPDSADLLEDDPEGPSAD